MKLKLGLIIVIAALVTFGLSGAAFAFHGGGVAQCEGCHTMHNSVGGLPVSAQSNTEYNSNALPVGEAGPFLLKASDQSSACLNCHAKPDTAPKSYHIMSLGQPIPTERTPGGDFAWLNKSSKKGHSIVAIDYGYTEETTKAGGLAPGGTYPVGALHCSSCHDPHGKYRKMADNTFATTGNPIAESGSYGADPSADKAVGAYRLLGGKLYLPKSIGIQTALAFDEDPIHAAAPDPYNASEAVSEVVVNYGKGTGAWCQQCHPKMHSIVGTGVRVHPNDVSLNTTIANIYNDYVSSGRLVPGGGGYTSLVPVSYDNQTVNSTIAGHFTTGMDVATNDQVNCLSCHRAHASAFDYMLRFPIVEEMVIDDGAGNPIYASGGRDLPDLTAEEVQAGLYDRPASNWGIGQRSLCNKCHAKD